MAKRRGLLKRMENMKKWEDLDLQERDTMVVGCCFGLIVGALLGLCAASSIAAVVIAGLTQ